MGVRGEANYGFEQDAPASSNIQLKHVDKAENLTPESNRQKRIDDCGPACCSIKFLNRFRNPKWVLVFLSWAAFIQGFCINGLVNVVITTVEKRFSLQSTQTGIIASSYDIGSLIVMIPVAYLGGKLGANKPRWIACGLLILGLGSFVYTLPHFSTSSYTTRRDDDGESVELCGSNPTDEKCVGGTTGLSLYRFVFILGQLLHGAGAAPLITLGTTYLDENLDKATSALYIAIFQTWFVVGPALGYVVGGQLLSVHTDLTDSSGLTPHSSQWVGAWWPGFLVSCVMAIICSSILFFFPESLVEKDAEELSPTKSSKKFSLDKLPKYLVDLMSNATFLCVSIGQSMDSFAITGLSAFLPKFMEHQYSLSGGVAAQLVGLMAIPGGGGGTFLGGFIIKKLRLNRTKIILMCTLSQVAALVPIAITFVLYCDNLPYVGINHSKPEEITKSYFPVPPVSSSSRLISSCNIDCKCDEDNLDPVCGSDKLMYLSPCMAGCSAFSSNYNMTDCACVEGAGSVSRTKCENECGNLIPYIIVQFVGILLTFLASMPGVVATLRAVEHEQRSLALGLQSIISRLIGTIPGPVIFGYIVDQACLLWKPSCDGSRSCLVYNNKQMAYTLLGTCFGVKILSVLFYTLGIFASKRSKIKDEIDKPASVKKSTSK